MRQRPKQPIVVRKKHLFLIASLILWGVAYCYSIFHKNIKAHMDLKQLVVVAPTFYGDLKDTRFELALDACRESARHSIRLILVDGSPNEQVEKQLVAAGRLNGKEYVRVVPQQKKGKKGVALREAIQLAMDELKEKNVPGIVAFQELEKVDMFRHWSSIVQHVTNTASDIVVPFRNLQSFEKYYPIEQFHMERFINMYLNSLSSTMNPPMVAIDWTIGPVAFKASVGHHWLNCQGDIWDAQLEPLLKAHFDQAKVASFEIDYRHPETMKKQEEGKPEWNQKRLMQANFLIKETVGKMMHDYIAATMLV